MVVVAAVLAAGLAVPAPAVGEPDADSPAMAELRMWPTPPSGVQIQDGDYPPFSLLYRYVASAAKTEMSNWVESNFPVGEPFNGIPFCEVTTGEVGTSWWWGFPEPGKASALVAVTRLGLKANDTGLNVKYTLYPEGSSATTGCHSTG